MAQPVHEMISGFIASQALHVAAKLAVFDLLRDGPKTTSEIAIATGSHEESLRRLLRFLSAVDVLHEDDQGRFASTKNGDLLRSDHPESMRPWAMLFGEPFFWKSWGNLYEAIETGVPGFNHAHGGENFFRLSEPISSGSRSVQHCYVEFQCGRVCCDTWRL